jgi:hypothetical protein
MASPQDKTTPCSNDFTLRLNTLFGSSFDRRFSFPPGWISPFNSMMVEFHLGKSAALVRSAQMISLEAEISTETEVSLAKVVRVVFAFPLDNVVFMVMFFDFGILTTGA